jgi:hypothetical protein
MLAAQKLKLFDVPKLISQIETKILFSFRTLLLVNLNVGLGECDHLRENVSDVKILHFEPLISRLVENVTSIGPFSWLAVVHNVCNQIVSSLGVIGFVLWCKNVTEIHVPKSKKICLTHVSISKFCSNSLDRKVDDRWILVDEESVFCESFDEQDDKLWQPHDFESLHKVVFVRFVLALVNSIELCKQLIQVDLRNNILAMFIDEQWRWWQVAREVEKVGGLDVLLVFFSRQQLLFLRVVALNRWNLSRENFHFAQKGFVDDAGVGALVASQLTMQLVQKPREKVNGIALFDYLESFVAPENDSL